MDSIVLVLPNGATSRVFFVTEQSVYTKFFRNFHSVGRKLFKQLGDETRRYGTPTNVGQWKMIFFFRFLKRLKIALEIPKFPSGIFSRFIRHPLPVSAFPLSFEQ